MTRQQIVTTVALAIAGLWVLTFVIRFWQPLPAASVLDQLMPIVATGWFAIVAKMNGAKT